MYVWTLAGTGAGPPRARPSAAAGIARGRLHAWTTEQGELELKAETADARPIRIDRDEPAGDGGVRGAILRRRVDQARTDRVDDLVEQRARVTAAVFEPVEDRHAGGGIARLERFHEAVDRGRIGHTEQVADRRFGDRVARHRKQLVEDRLGVAHPAGGEPGDECQRCGVDRPPVGLEDPRQLALDLRDREATDVIALEARQDGGRES